MSKPSAVTDPPAASRASRLRFGSHVVWSYRMVLLAFLLGGLVSIFIIVNQALHTGISGKDRLVQALQHAIYEETGILFTFHRLQGKVTLPWSARIDLQRVNFRSGIVSRQGKSILLPIERVQRKSPVFFRIATVELRLRLISLLRGIPEIAALHGKSPRLVLPDGGICVVQEYGEPFPSSNQRSYGPCLAVRMPKAEKSESIPFLKKTEASIVNARVQLGHTAFLRDLPPLWVNLSDGKVWDLESKHPFQVEGKGYLAALGQKRPVIRRFSIRGTLAPHVIDETLAGSVVNWNQVVPYMALVADGVWLTPLCQKQDPHCQLTPIDRVEMTFRPDSPHKDFRDFFSKDNRPHRLQMAIQGKQPWKWQLGYRARSKIKTLQGMLPPWSISVDALLAAKGDRLDLRQLLVHSGVLQVKAKGVIREAEDQGENHRAQSSEGFWPHLELWAQVPRHAIEPWAPWLISIGQPPQSAWNVKGWLTIPQIHMDGPLNQPRLKRAAVKLDGGQISNRQSFLSNISTELEFNNHLNQGALLVLKNLSGEVLKGTLQGRGQIKWIKGISRIEDIDSGQLDGTFSLNKLALNTLPSFLKALKIDVPPMAGAISAKAKIAGTLKIPQWKGDAILNDVRMGPESSPWLSHFQSSIGATAKSVVIHPSQGVFLDQVPFRLEGHFTPGTTIAKSQGTIQFKAKRNGDTPFSLSALVPVSQLTQSTGMARVLEHLSLDRLSGTLQLLPSSAQWPQLVMDVDPMTLTHHQSKDPVFIVPGRVSILPDAVPKLRVEKSTVSLAYLGAMGGPPGSNPFISLQGTTALGGNDYNFTGRIERSSADVLKPLSRWVSVLTDIPLPAVWNTTGFFSGDMALDSQKPQVHLVFESLGLSWQNGLLPLYRVIGDVVWDAKQGLTLKKAFRFKYGNAPVAIESDTKVTPGGLIPAAEVGIRGIVTPLELNAWIQQQIPGWAEEPDLFIPFEGRLVSHGASSFFADFLDGSAMFKCLFVYAKTPPKVEAKEKQSAPLTVFEPLAEAYREGSLRVSKKDVWVDRLNRWSALYPQVELHIEKMGTTMMRLHRLAVSFPEAGQWVMSGMVQPGPERRGLHYQVHLETPEPFKLPEGTRYIRNSDFWAKSGTVNAKVDGEGLWLPPDHVGGASGWLNTFTGGVEAIGWEIPGIALEQFQGALTMAGDTGKLVVERLALPQTQVQVSANIPSWSQFPLVISDVAISGQSFWVEAFDQFLNKVVIDQVILPVGQVVLLPLGIPQEVALPYAFFQADVSLDEAIFNNILLQRVRGKMSQYPNGHLELEQLAFDMAGGTISGRLAMSPRQNQMVALNLDIADVKANALAKALLNAPNQIFGDLSGHLHMTSRGVGYDEVLSNTNGILEVEIENGRLPAIAKIETLLTAANVIRGGVLGLNLNNILRTLAPFDTNYFAKLSGKMDIAKGMVYVNPLISDGENLDLTIIGKIRLQDAFSDLTVLGEMTQDVSGALGPLGKVSINRFLRFIPGLGFIPGVRNGGLLQYIPGVGYVPGLGGPAKPTNRFQVKIHGLLEDPSAVQQMKWVDEFGSPLSSESIAP